jgi:solute carrier family 35, member E1
MKKALYLCFILVYIVLGGCELPYLPKRDHLSRNNDKETRNYKKESVTIVGMQDQSNTNLISNDDMEEIESRVLLTINEPVSSRSVVIEQTNYLSLLSKHIEKILTQCGYNGKYWLSVLKVSLYFFLWYFFTVVYNISNKRFLNVIPLPATVATLQLLLGIPVFIPIWIAKPIKYNRQDLFNHMKIASMHGLGNWASIVAYGSGSVSFVHVVKALEPVVAAGLSIWITQKSFPFIIYLSIIPIVVGVAIASATEVTFTWIGFISAMLSNIFYQMRMVLAKEVVSNDKPNISASNLFRIITILAAIELIPIALLVEGLSIFSYWKQAISNGIPQSLLVSNLLISGVSFYMYNEVAFWLLELIHPVTHAVGNTVKRVVIILASVMILKSPVNAVGIAGASLAVTGTLIYSLAQQRYKSNTS